ncbi:MAG: hypothetical protein PHV53_11580 [Fermentimonas sp.]|nr:hypothetical protein [Fermentimonas sp.]
MGKKYHSYFDVGLMPKDGTQGDPGPTYYPAGIYDDTIEYVRTKIHAPYVITVSGQYYVLEKFGITKGVDPETDTTGTWIIFDFIKYAFFEVAMVNFGKIAAAVFSGNVMMSQYGIDGTNNYKNYSGEAGAWQPNILFNFLTGSGHLAGGNIKWDEEGNSLFTGSIQSSDEGNKIVIDGGDRSLKMINKYDKQLVNFYFYEGTSGWGTSYPVLRMDLWRKDAIGEWTWDDYTDYSPFGIDFRSWENSLPWVGQLNSSSMNISYGWEGTASERRISINLFDDQYLEMRMKGSVISNLSLKPRIILGSSSVWLDHWDVFVTCYNTANINVYLPSSPSLGAIKFIRRMNASSITVMGNGKQISHGNGSISTSIPAGSGRGDTAVFFWDGQYWTYNYWVRDPN